MKKISSQVTGQFKSKFIGRLMNRFHTKRYEKIFETLTFSENESILDIGCGGGGVLKYFLKKLKRSKCFGLDLSPQMIELSRKVNKRFVKQKRVQFLQGSALDIPGPDDTFTLVLALESINYWSDPELGIADVNRVLKDKGRFLIINRYPSEKSKWYDRVHFKTTLDYEKSLKKNGFKIMSMDLHVLSGWVVILAEKAPGQTKEKAS